MVPFHHQPLLVQMLHSILDNSDAASAYHNYDYYSFSGLKGQIKVVQAGLCFLSSKVTLVLSCPDDEFVKHVLTRLFEQPIVEIGQLRLIPDSVLQEEMPPLSTSQKYVSISPIVVQAQWHNNADSKRFINPKEDLFSDLLYESTMSRMERSGRYSSEQISSFFKFQVIPDEQYLEKIKVEEKKFARIYPASLQHQKIEVRGYTLPFTLLAAQEVQQFVFDCGFGEVTHLGFGMIDIANTQFVSRVKEYTQHQPMAFAQEMTTRPKSTFVPRQNQ
jgi:CRISPR-associated endoribonuclease Cas6